ncbi:hypothetical protein ACLOJK_014255 [Asimina triloba]
MLHCGTVECMRLFCEFGYASSWILCLRSGSLRLVLVVGCGCMGHTFYVDRLNGLWAKREGGAVNVSIDIHHISCRVPHFSAYRMKRMLGFPTFGECPSLLPCDLDGGSFYGWQLFPVQQKTGTFLIRYKRPTVPSGKLLEEFGVPMIIVLSNLLFWSLNKKL